MELIEKNKGGGATIIQRLFIHFSLIKEHVLCYADKRSSPILIAAYGIDLATEFEVFTWESSSLAE